MNNIITSAILGILAMPAFAIPNPIPNASELPEFEQFGENISVPNYSNRVIYKFNPPTTGTLTVLSVNKGSDMDLFVSEIYNASDYTVVAERYMLGTFIEDVPEGYNFGYEYNMNPDQVFYISIPITTFNTTTEVKFLWEDRETEAGAITSIFPDPTMDTYYNYLTEQNIVVQADGALSSFGEVTISYLDEVVPIRGNRISGPANGEFLTIAIADPGAPNYVLPAVEAGADSFTITINDYKVNGLPVVGNETGNDNVTVDNGKITFSYKLAKAPAYNAEESTWPTTFYNYWEEGDPAGMATLVFDQPIVSVGEATLIMAKYNLGESGGEEPSRTYTLKSKVDGNKAIIDFTGQNFRGDTNVVSVFIMNVKGETGLPATFDGYLTGMVEQLPFVNEAAPENPNIPGAVGTVAPESGTIFEVGEDIVITVAFDGEVEQNYIPNAPVFVTNYNDYEETFTWSPNVVYIEGNAIVINLGSELEPSTYYLSLREGAVMVDGTPNAEIDGYTFIVEKEETGSIDSIGAVNGVKDIYDLNGVKVNENKLEKGVYIINGKKVLISR